MPYINAIGTATPPHCLPQTRIAQFMADALQLQDHDRRRLMALHRATGIHQRYSVLADYGTNNGNFLFFPNTPDLEPFPSVATRMQAYHQHAAPLAARAVDRCLQQYPDFDLNGVTHLITVSCTGMYAPGLDIELVEMLGLKTHVQRTAINFMGCYGAFNGMKLADTICRADPDAKVLLICVELCSLHFQKSLAEDHLLSNALFADGAAAVVVEAQPREGIALQMSSFYCDLVLAGKREMAWHIADFGFEMTLSAYVPDLIEKGIRQLIARLLQNTGLEMEAIDHFAIHPGGRRILEVIEKQLGLTSQDNRYAYGVLQQYGNMSSPTVLFVLAAVWKDLTEAHARRNILSCAFGPGLTLESMVLEVVANQSETSKFAEVRDYQDLAR
ncbi:MAG: type III polyketide synthase [Ferruginibacter sp.]|nr:type III polyketide synthase [Cytophagales bacterium]